MKDSAFLFSNGRIFTANHNIPWVEAVVVLNGTIVFAGKTAHARREYGKRAEAIDLKGRLLIPGFNDGHVHFADGGITLMGIDLRRANGRTGIRHRIEHAQMVRDQDMETIQGLNIVLSLQPSHCLADMKWAKKRIGERAPSAYRLRSLLEKGSPVAFGSDWPVETLDPLFGLYAAVTRMLPDGSASWFPSEAITLAEAITAYTSGSAFAEGQDHVKGSITAGKAADLIVLDRDIFQVPLREILETRVDMTFLDGRPVFAR